MGKNVKGISGDCIVGDELQVGDDVKLVKDFDNEGLI
jgi:hypothetical protein